MIILAIQSTYTSIEIGLYQKEPLNLIACSSISKADTAHLLKNIDTLLINASLSIEHLAVCIVNRGPAPFTTLRTVIATVNGLKASLKIPVIGVNGLEALNSEYTKEKKNGMIVLNAFAHDFYFYINAAQNGLCSFNKIREIIEQNNIINIIGNGGPLIKDVIQKNINYQFIDSEKGTCSLNTLISQGIYLSKTVVENEIFNTYVSPLYFKEINIF